MIEKLYKVENYIKLRYTLINYLQSHYKEDIRLLLFYHLKWYLEYCANCNKLKFSSTYVKLCSYTLIKYWKLNSICILISDNSYR